MDWQVWIDICIHCMISDMNHISMSVELDELQDCADTLYAGVAQLVREVKELRDQCIAKDRAMDALMRKIRDYWHEGLGKHDLPMEEVMQFYRSALCELFSALDD